MLDIVKIGKYLKSNLGAVKRFFNFQKQTKFRTTIFEFLNKQCQSEPVEDFFGYTSTGSVGQSVNYIMNIKDAQLTVDNWIKDHGVRYFNELTNMAQLTEEVGEVARIIARRYGEQSEKESDKNKDLGEELADVLFVVLCLANQTGINLQEAFDKKLVVKTKRDHDRHQNNEKLK